MKHFFTIAAIFCLTSIATSSFAQNEFKRAEQKYEGKQYSDAISLYKVALARGKGDQDRTCECLWKIAESFRLNGDHKQAKIWHEKVITQKCAQSEKSQLYIEERDSIDFASDSTTSNTDVIYQTYDKSYLLVKERYLLSTEERGKFDRAIYLHFGNQKSFYKSEDGSTVKLKLKDIDSAIVVFASDSVTFMFHYPSINKWIKNRRYITHIENVKKSSFSPAKSKYFLSNTRGGVSIVAEKKSAIF